MEIRGFIFDLDGVLVSTDEFHYQAWKKLADESDIYFDRTINQRLRGISRMESLEIILEKCEGKTFSQEEKEQLAEKKNQYYKTFLSGLTPEDVTGEVRETLKKLREQGYKLAVGSSSKNAKYILEKIGLTKAFDAISDGNNISNSKPDPEVFLKAAEFLQLSPKQCAVVEDAKAGIDAAAAAGMFAVGIGDAASYKKADKKITTMKELLSIIENE